MRERLLLWCLALAMAFVFVTPVSQAAALSTQGELEAAISAAAGPVTLTLDADTVLSSTLTIPAGKDITLAGEYKLIGANGAVTIAVNGTLTLDGVTVTHNGADTGSGVIVNTGATLIMTSGAISGNTSAVGVTPNGNGGGVFNSGTVILSGGSISGNTSVNEAGGVFNNSGTVTIFDNAAISGNTSAKYAGGLYNHTGTVTMSGGEISGNTATQGGGGARNQGATATFTMSGGSISGNTSLGDVGAGVLNMAGATFTMSGGAINDNTNSSASSGGGVANLGSTFTMSGGEISGNTAPSGGGVLNWNGATFIMSGGEIAANITTSASSKGGGVYNYGPATFTLDGGTIANHTTTLNGGGIYSTNGASLVLTSGTISGNVVTGDGGGAWIDDPANLVLGSDITFSGNRAGAAYALDPDDEGTYGPDYNNYDLNYTGGTRILYKVAYDDNGSTKGTAPTDDGQYNPLDVVTVAGQDDLAREGYTFLGWATNPEATAAEYLAGETFEITDNTTLYAVWQKDEVNSPVNPDPANPGGEEGSEEPSKDVTSTLPKAGDALAGSLLFPLLMAVGATGVFAYRARRQVQ